MRQEFRKMFDAQEKEHKQEILAKDDQNSMAMQSLTSRLQTAEANNSSQFDLIHSFQKILQTIVGENKALKAQLVANEIEFQDACVDWQAQLARTTDSLNLIFKERISAISTSQKEQFTEKIQQVEQNLKQQIKDFKHEQTSFV